MHADLDSSGLHVKQNEINKKCMPPLLKYSASVHAQLDQPSRHAQLYSINQVCMQCSLKYYTSMYANPVQSK